MAWSLFTQFSHGCLLSHFTLRCLHGQHAVPRYDTQPLSPDGIRSKQIDTHERPDDSGEEGTQRGGATYRSAPCDARG